MSSVVGLRDYRRSRRRKENGTTQQQIRQRQEIIKRVGTATIVLTRDDTPIGHGGLALKLVLGIEAYGDDTTPKGQPISLDSFRRLDGEGDSDFVGAFGEIDTPTRARKKQLDKKRSSNKLSSQSIKRTPQPQATADAFQNSFSGFSQDTSVDQSLDPLNSFAPTTERLPSKPTLLLGQEPSDSDDELFADEQIYSGSFTRRASGDSKLRKSLQDKSITVSPIESSFPEHASPAKPAQKRSPVLGVGSLALKDTLPRHPRNLGGVKAGTADWTKLMMETRTCEHSEVNENTSTVEDDSVENSTVSSGSALHRTGGEDTFAQLDLGDSNGIRMICRTDVLDDNDSTGLHNRRALTEKGTDSKRQNVMFSGISALKSLGTEMILKAETTITQPRSNAARKTQGGGLASARSMSFRLNSGKPASSAISGNSELGRPKAPPRAKSLFPTKEGSSALFVDDDQSDQGIE